MYKVTYIHQTYSNSSNIPQKSIVQNFVKIIISDYVDGYVDGSSSVQCFMSCTHFDTFYLTCTSITTSLLCISYRNSIF